MRSLPDVLLMLAAGVVVGSCSHARPPKAATVEAKHIGTPRGVWFDEACTPTGPEVCANAIDDNCNGLIDEGCGLQNSKLQFEAAWEHGNATVELSVSDPQGDKIDLSHRATPSGLRLDHQCPQDGCPLGNVANVIYLGESPLPGLYTVDVKLVDAGSSTLPLKVQFGWRVGNRLAGTAFTLSSVKEKKEFSFEI